MGVNEMVSPDQFKLIITLTTSLILGFINMYLKGYSLRLYYGLITGMILQFYMFGLGSLNIHIACWMTLLIIKLLPRKKVGWAVTIYVFIHISILNIWRMIYDYGGWTMDSSVCFMTTLPKFCAFAFCYQDGQDIEKLSQHKKKFAFENFTLSQFVCYIFFYSTAIIGPFFEFNDLLDYLHERKEFEKIPSTLKPALTRFFLAIGFSIFYVVTKKYSTVKYFLDNLGSKWVPDILIYCFFYTIKFKYYAGFLFTESACISSGLSYQKTEKEENFERARHVSIIKSDNFKSVQTFFHYWNMSIHLWLKRYVFFRFYSDEEYSQKSKATKAKVYTFLISGFWHGFYPCYYIIFTHFAMMLVAEENIHYIKNNLINNPYLKKLWHFSWHISCYIIGLFVCGILQELHVYDAIHFMKILHFAPTILTIAWVVVTHLIIKIFKKKRTQDSIKES